MTLIWSLLGSMERYLQRLCGKVSGRVCVDFYIFAARCIGLCESNYVNQSGDLYGDLCGDLCGDLYGDLCGDLYGDLCEDLITHSKTDKTPINQYVTHFSISVFWPFFTYLV